MKRWKSRALAAIIALLAIGGGIAVTASPAAAAAGCYGDYCSGKDPSTTGVGGVPCGNDAVTVQSSPIYSQGGEISIGGISIGLGGSLIGQLELRWSNHCGTNWARLNLAVGGNFRHLTVRQDTGYEQTNELLAFGHYYLPPGIYFTNMIYSPVHAAQAYLSKPPWWVATLWA